MQLYSFSLSLRIWHPTIDPDFITRTLGLEPKSSSMVGTPRQTPNGRPLGGVYAESYWWSDPFDRGGYLSADQIAEDILTGLLEVLRPHKKFLLLIQAQGGRSHLEINSFSKRNYSLVLPPDLLIEIAELGLCFVHDVYPYEQNW
ncbi:DUF4279 domain-containing protein [Achromobacter spanius]|uniref:DUF4279 domain-containing protein n=1 Tax=Achromobacter spanius TaxID=217203 RepID=A0A2S0ICW9_9BURK|nr:DUF4279 domain-containing protein [Achromobacter spanius]AVJ29856.1 hypothetical protein CLM73_23685 [Achromobacter spanius]